VRAVARPGKRTRAAREAVGGAAAAERPLEEALLALRGAPAARFDESVEVALRLGIDPRRADQGVRGAVVLPHGTGRAVRVAVFARGARADEARAAGAEVVGAEDLAEAIEGGRIDFDRAVASPDLMPVVGRLGRVLGPRGLMPNPKLGTVTPDVAAAVRAAKGGQVEYRADKAGIVHAAVGKRSFDDERLAENVRALVEAVRRARPAGAKGAFLRRVSISCTMGPGVRVEPSSI